MHHYHTHQCYNIEHGYDSQAFFLVITNKIDNLINLIILHLSLIYHCGMFVILYEMFIFTSSYIYPSSMDMICITTLQIKVKLIIMIHRLFSWSSEIRLILVLTLDSYSSWWIVCTSILNVCPHFFLYVSIFN